MGSTSSRNSRGNPYISILMPVIAGVLIGVAGYLIKIVMSSVSLNAGFLVGVLTQPLAYVSGVLGLVGFLLFQKSLYKGKVSVVTPIMSGLSILIPVALAILLLGEPSPPLKLVGIVLILVGVAGLRD